MTLSDYYEENALAYYRQTMDADPSAFLSPLIRLLPAGACILDIGCGSGRDLLWLKARGFRAAGLERSPALAKLAREHSGCPVTEGDMAEFDFESGRWDAVLMVGSLVHIPHAGLEAALRKLLSVLPPSCLILVTMKEGSGPLQQGDGRMFYLWSDADLRKIYSNLNLEIVSMTRNISAIGTREAWLGYVLKKFAARGKGAEAQRHKVF